MISYVKGSDVISMHLFSNYFNSTFYFHSACYMYVSASVIAFFYLPYSKHVHGIIVFKVYLMLHIIFINLKFSILVSYCSETCHRMFY